MTGRNVIEVRGEIDGSWAVEQSGNPQSRQLFSTMAAAMDEARSLAETMPPAKIVVQNPDGTLAEEIAVGEDPDELVLPAS